MIIDIPAFWQSQCARFGFGTVWWYQQGKPASAKVQARRHESLSDIRFDPKIQEVGKACEVALCLHLGLDPAKALDWMCDEEKPGADLHYKGTPIDVKGSPHPKASKLIWPGHKALPDPEKTPRLVLTLARSYSVANNTRQIELLGSITYKKWLEIKTVSDGSDRLAPGTPYVPLDALKPI